MNRVPAIKGSRVNASKRIDNRARGFMANGLPSQVAMHPKQVRPAVGLGFAWHFCFAREIVGRETNIHLSNRADNGLAYTIVGEPGPRASSKGEGLEVSGCRHIES